MKKVFLFQTSPVSMQKLIKMICVQGYALIPNSVAKDTIRQMNVEPVSVKKYICPINQNGSL